MSEAGHSKLFGGKRERGSRERKRWRKGKKKERGGGERGE
jgi:hypothetical protein